MSSIDEKKANEPEATNEENQSRLCYDLGTFEGFNFKSQSAIPRNLTADEVVNWDHDGSGEAEFWPSGDCPGVSLLFQSQTSVTGHELLELDRILQDVGDDSMEKYLKIRHVVCNSGSALESVTAGTLEDLSLHIFAGGSFLDLRKEAAYELFELYYPEEYKTWEKSHCDGLIFDTDHFLDSPVFSVEEVKFGDDRFLIIDPQ